MMDENNKTNWPDAVLGVAFLLFLLLICLGDNILEAIK